MWDQLIHRAPIMLLTFSARSYRALCKRTGACDPDIVEDVDKPNGDSPHAGDLEKGSN